MKHDDDGGRRRVPNSQSRYEQPGTDVSLPRPGATTRVACEQASAGTEPGALFARSLRTASSQIAQLRLRALPVLEAATRDRRVVLPNELLSIRSTLRRVDEAMQQARALASSDAHEHALAEFDRERAPLRSRILELVAIQDEIATPALVDAAMAEWARNDLARREAELAGGPPAPSLGATITASPVTLAPSAMERAVISASRRGDGASDRFGMVANMSVLVGERSDDAWRADVAALAPRVGLAGATVRVDDRARTMTDQRRARGVANDGVVYLHPERARPGTLEGREVLAHELVHVAQSQLPAIHDDVVDPGRAEQEADDLARRMIAGERVVPSERIDRSSVASDNGDRNPTTKKRRIQGIQLYLLALDSLPPYAIGKVFSVVGPYRIVAFHRPPSRDHVLYYVAWQVNRKQYEWVIGAESIHEFVGAVDFYVGAAASALPGSTKLPDTRKDGASDPIHLPSMLELEAKEQAPWQQGRATAPGADVDYNGLSRGGQVLVATRDARIRIKQYVRPARRLAKVLEARVLAGEIDHLDARANAVDGRNALLDDTRSRLSPGTQTVSVKLKETGKTLDQMAQRKVAEGLDSWHGIDSRGRRLSAEKLAAAREALAADSAMWERLAATHDPRTPASARALRELGASPRVSMEIIKSAGRSNRLVTAAAYVTGYGGPAIGSAFIGYSIYKIVSAEEGQRLHVAAGELMGFVGGTLGSQVGMTFFASLIPGAAGAGSLLAVSLIGSVIGAAVGAALLPTGMSALATTMGKLTTTMTPMTSTAAGGGYAGIVERQRLADQHPTDLATKIADLLWQMDQDLLALENRIRLAPSTEALQTLQRERLDLLRNRDELGTALHAVRIGMVDDGHGAER